MVTQNNEYEYNSSFSSTFIESNLTKYPGVDSTVIITNVYGVSFTYR